MIKSLSVVAKIFLASVTISVLGRLIFLLVQFGAAADLGVALWLQTFIYGLMLDISVAGYITALPMVALLLGVWCGGTTHKRVWVVALRIYLYLIAIAVAAVVATDALMYGHWGYRIDATLLPYLTSPTEATASATPLDAILWSVTFITVAAVSIVLYTLATKGFEIKRLKPRQRALWTPLLLLIAGVIFLAIRGGVSKSVANVSKVYFSTIQFANHAAVNPTFSLLSSAARVEDYDKMYPFYQEEELLRQFSTIAGNKASTPERKILTTERPNIAIVIAESYTKHIMEMEIEGREVMPNLRRIAAEGLEFSNTYAAGARTDRGVAAVLSGFPTQPKLSIMKIPAKSRHLPSIAASLPEAYSSSFYYGGDLNFMDMASYLYATGWQRLVWDRDLSPAEAPRNWGYSDGVTMSHFADEVISLDEKGTPFLATLLTLSSHEPFDVPEEMGISDRMLNSMAYSDAKLGEMVARLQASPAWENLLLIIVADHTFAYPYDVSYNSPLRHHIPLIMSGGALAERGVVESYISQIDIPATLLSQMGLPHSDYLFSRDIFDASSPHYGYYTFSDGFGVVTPGGAVIYDNTMQRAGRAAPNGGDVEVLTDGEELLSEEGEMVEWGKTMLQMTHFVIEGL